MKTRLARTAVAVTMALCVGTLVVALDWSRLVSGRVVWPTSSPPRMDSITVDRPATAEWIKSWGKPPLHKRTGPVATTFDYDRQPRRDARTTQLYDEVLASLRGQQAIPRNRWAYYRQIDNRNGCQVTGWTAFISDVRPNARGHVVTVYVIPSLLSDDFGEMGHVLDASYTEDYQVNRDGTVTYQGFADPGKRSGKMPLIAIL